MSLTTPERAHRRELSNALAVLVASPLAMYLLIKTHYPLPMAVAFVLVVVVAGGGSYGALRHARPGRTRAVAFLGVCVAIALTTALLADILPGAIFPLGAFVAASAAIAGCVLGIFDHQRLPTHDDGEQGVSPPQPETVTGDGRSAPGPSPEAVEVVRLALDGQGFLVDPLVVAKVLQVAADIEFAPEPSRPEPVWTVDEDALKQGCTEIAKTVYSDTWWPQGKPAHIAERIIAPLIEAGAVKGPPLTLGGSKKRGSRLGVEFWDGDTLVRASIGVEDYDVGLSSKAYDELMDALDAGGIDDEAEAEAVRGIAETLVWRLLSRLHARREELGI